MNGFTEKDIENERKFAELRSEAKKYSELIRETYLATLVSEGDGILVCSYGDKTGYRGNGNLYLNRWIYQDNMHLEFSWAIETSEEGLFECMKYAYLCESGQMLGDWDIPMKYFRMWMARLERSRA